MLRFFSFILLFSLIIFASCNSNREQESSISYDSLYQYLTSNQPIYGEYLKMSNGDSLAKAIVYHEIVQDANEYIISKSSDGGTAVKGFYLLSFSKETGRLLNYIHLGNEAEGASPKKVNWSSDSIFFTVDYNYELLEDEEGFYYQGELIDSLVMTYSINSNGIFTPL